jgi:hypothetical protein
VVAQIMYRNSKDNWAGTHNKKSASPSFFMKERTMQYVTHFRRRGGSRTAPTSVPQNHLFEFFVPFVYFVVKNSPSPTNLQVCRPTGGNHVGRPVAAQTALIGQQALPGHHGCLRYYGLMVMQQFTSKSPRVTRHTVRPTNGRGTMSRCVSQNRFALIWQQPLAAPCVTRPTSHGMPTNGREPRRETYCPTGQSIMWQQALACPFTHV